MLTEMMASQGYDIIWIDLEHSPLTSMDAINNVIAARAGGAASMVRIAWNDPARAKPILDMGPDIILFPNILGLEDAKKAIRACEYPPKGIRGYGPQRACGFGEIDPKGYIFGPKRTLVAIQIETRGAVEDLESIAKLDGIDLFIVGPCDLSISMGFPGQMEVPEMKETYDYISETLRRNRRFFGVSTSYDPSLIREWNNRGAQLLFSGYDTVWVHDGAKETFLGMQSIIREHT